VLAVTAVTAVLVNLTPGRAASGDLAVRPFNGTKTVATGKVNLEISPAKAGANSLHIGYLTNDDRQAVHSRPHLHPRPGERAAIPTGVLPASAAIGGQPRSFTVFRGQDPGVARVSLPG